MSGPAHLGFLLCVALATFAQNATGFAFGLLLLGLTSLLQLAPVETVANVSSVLTLVNACILLRRRPALRLRLLLAVLACSVVGVVAGVELLGVLGQHARNLLQMLLGTTIVLCSLLLVFQAQALPRLSRWPVFSGFALLSGMMGGMFSSAGPPLVYQLYRQPLPAEVVRDTLILVFACNALLRLVLVSASGRFDSAAGYLSLEALPLVLLLTRYMRNNPPKFSPRTLRLGVFALLLLAGASLLGQALLAPN